MKPSSVRHPAPIVAHAGHHVAAALLQLEPDRAAAPQRLGGVGDQVHEDLEQALQQMWAESPALKGLILDLRSNPGGLLSDSLGPRKTVSLFMLLAGIGSIILGLAPGLGEAVVAAT